MIGFLIGALAGMLFSALAHTFAQWLTERAYSADLDACEAIWKEHARARGLD